MGDKALLSAEAVMFKGIPEVQPDCGSELNVPNVRGVESIEGRHAFDGMAKKPFSSPVLTVWTPEGIRPVRSVIEGRPPRCGDCCR